MNLRQFLINTFGHTARMASMLIAHRNVRVNGVVKTNPALTLQDGDVVSDGVNAYTYIEG